jgi:CRISPR-associated protein Csx16
MTMILPTRDPEPAAVPAEAPRDCVVTRHPGAAEWVQRHLGRTVRVVDHLHPHEIVPGTRYHGVFPLNLAAAICHAGAQCWAISMQVPPELRGRELGAEQLEALGARLVRYQVSEVADAAGIEGPNKPD